MNIKTALTERERIKWTLYHRLYQLKGIKPLPLVKSKKNEIILVHINKTAGTSIAVAIGMKMKVHMTAQEIIREIGRKRFDNAFSFAFVRNPWSKTVSQYKYGIKTGRLEKYFGKITFTEWVKQSYGKENPKFFKYENPKMYYPQFDWLTNFKGDICVDFIGRFENIAEDFQKINEKLGTNFELKHHNKTKKKKSYRDYYNTETKKIIEKAFKKDIEYFHYEF